MALKGERRGRAVELHLDSEPVSQARHGRAEAWLVTYRTVPRSAVVRLVSARNSAYRANGLPWSRRGPATRCSARPAAQHACLPLPLRLLIELVVVRLAWR